MIMYRTYTSHFFIEPIILKVEVDKVTDKSVWVNGRVMRKKAGGYKFWSTWKEAHEFLISKAEAHNKRAASAHYRSKETLVKIICLKEEPNESTG